MGRECGRTQATGPNKNARRWAIWLRAKETPDKDAVLYLIAKGGEPTVNKGSGDNPAIVLLTVLGVVAGVPSSAAGRMPFVTGVIRSSGLRSAS